MGLSSKYLKKKKKTEPLCEHRTCTCCGLRLKAWEQWRILHQVKGALYKVGKTAINLYKSNSLATKFTKQKSLEMQGELHGEKVLKGNFSRTERSRQRIGKFTLELATDV